MPMCIDTVAASRMRKKSLSTVDVDKACFVQQTKEVPRSVVLFQKCSRNQPLDRHSATTLGSPIR